MIYSFLSRLISSIRTFFSAAGGEKDYKKSQKRFTLNYEKNLKKIQKNLLQNL